MKPSRDDIVTLFDKFDKDFREFALRLTVGIKHFFCRRRSLSIALSSYPVEKITLFQGKNKLHYTFPTG